MHLQRPVNPGEKPAQVCIGLFYIYNLPVGVHATRHSGLPHLPQALSSILNPGADGQHYLAISAWHLRPGARHIHVDGTKRPCPRLKHLTTPCNLCFQQPAHITVPATDDPTILGLDDRTSTREAHDQFVFSDPKGVATLAGVEAEKSKIDHTVQRAPSASHDTSVVSGR